MGGSLPTRAGGWRLERIQDRITESFLLIDERTQRSSILGSFVTDTRAYGFSSTGKIIVIAVSSDLAIFTWRP
jgi:hypothetical protein